YNPGLLDDILALQKDIGFDPTRIEFEITESMLMRGDKDAIDTLQAMKEKGFGLAIDDFGTGYSNLAYIQRYPITSLKVDRSFVDTVETNDAVARLVVSLCRIIGVKSVAEGVETPAQLAWMRENGCDEYQGFLYSRPLSLEHFETLLDDEPEEDLLICDMDPAA
ncbi:MAG: EAL domain-containing protein, partial [Pseudomonadota bacterium]